MPQVQIRALRLVLYAVLTRLLVWERASSLGVRVSFPFGGINATSSWTEIYIGHASHVLIAFYSVH